MTRFRPFLLLFLFFLTGAMAREVADYGQYRPSTFEGQLVLVNWNSPEGRARLRRASQSEDFYQLAHHFQPQANPLYCGIASSVIVLNAMRAGRRPIPSQAAMEVRIPGPWGGRSIPYPLYAQGSLLNADTERVKPRAVIEFQQAAGDGKPDPGLTLAQLQGVLEAYGAKVESHPAAAAEPEGVEVFREHLRRVLGETEHFLIVNYQSRLLGQAGGGHISPLGAYDEISDSVLVLDVSGHLNPWLWVPVRDLYLAMHTLDGERYRGYLILTDADL